MPGGSISGSEKCRQNHKMPVNGKPTVRYPAAADGKGSVWKTAKEGQQMESGKAWQHYLPFLP